MWKLILTLCFSLFSSLQALALDLSQIHLGADLYGVHTNLMPYKGTEDTATATVYLHYDDWRLVPFIRGTYSSYYYLNEAGGNTAYTSDRRTALGAGLDYNLTSYLRIRAIEETVHNELANDHYDQFSYGLIYNQYLGVGWFDLNNYAEAFNIPRIDSGEWDAFVRLQALKAFTIASNGSSVHQVYPFVQFKAKINDNDLFGVSGNNASVGAGYKWIKSFENKSQLALLLEGHSLFYQSTHFNADWNQVLATIQYVYF